MRDEGDPAVQLGGQRARGAFVMSTSYLIQILLPKETGKGELDDRTKSHRALARTSAWLSVEALRDLFRLPKAEGFVEARDEDLLAASGLQLHHKTTHCACTPTRQRRCCSSIFKFASSRGPPTRPAIFFAVLEASRTYCFPASCRVPGRHFHPSRQKLTLAPRLGSAPCRSYRDWGSPS